MTAYLLDTSVLSEFAPRRLSFSPAVELWMEQRAEGFHLSTIVLAEARRGIAQLYRRDQAGDRARANDLQDWLDDTIAKFGPRVLPFDVAVAMAGGDLADWAYGEGVHPGFADTAIAATAKVHGLTILTRNLKHFIALNVPCLDPFEPR